MAHFFPTMVGGREKTWLYTMLSVEFVGLSLRKDLCVSETTGQGQGDSTKLVGRRM